MSEQENRCKSTTKSGKPCRAAATENGYCFFHANPQIASKLGRVGGRKNRHVIETNATALPKLDSITAVQEALSIMIADVHANRLHPRTAAGVAPLINSLLRAMGAGELEKRIMQLEQQVEDMAAEDEQGGRVDNKEDEDDD